MMRTRRWRPFGSGLAFGVSLLLGACGGEQSIFGAPNPGAAAVEGLWWLSLAGTGVLATLVIVGLLMALRRARGRSGARGGGEAPVAPHDPAEEAGARRFILAAGVGLPTVFLVGFLAFAVRTGSEVVSPPGDPAFTIEVVGHKFWWEVIYPDHGITTANELHIPVGSVVRLRVTSADVIHSFWVPQFTPGKVDMVPGRTNTLWMLAEEPGRARGQCTEFCGLQHALMSLSVTAHPPEDFAAWIAARQAPRPPLADPDAAEGLGVFFRAGCGSCHAIEGVRPPDPRGMAGPDLTHLASRETLGALTIPNDRANLAAWLVDPHQFKPGVRMPPTPLPSAELAALVAYLETLE